MNRQLLFASSYAFENADISDHIRQSLIDIEVDPPSPNEIKELFSQGLNYLSNPDLTYEVACDLAVLLSKCINKYPTELTSTLNQSLENLSKTTEKTFIQYYVLVYILGNLQNPDKVGNPCKSASFVDFCNKFFKEISQQITNDSLNTYKICDCDFPKNVCVQMIILLFSSNGFTKELLIEFGKYVFQKDLISHNPIFKNIFKHVLEQKLVEYLPSNVFEYSFFYSQFTDEELIEVYSAIPKESFQRSITRLESICVDRKNEQLGLTLLNRAIECEKSLTKIPYILKFVKPSSLTPELWAFLKEYSFRLPSEFVDQISDFSDLEFFVKVLPNPQSKLTQEQMSTILTQTTDKNLLELVLSRGSIQNPVLTTPEFWIKFVNIVIPQCENQILSKVFNCFRLNNSSSDQMKLLQKIIESSMPPTDAACIFVYTFINPKRQIRQEFMNNPFLINYTKKLTKLPPNGFWKLFSNDEPLEKLLIDTTSQQYPIFVQGYASYFWKELMEEKRKIMQLHEVSVWPQTESTIQELTSFCNSMINDTAKGTGEDISIIFFKNVSELSPAALTLVNAAQLYAIHFMTISIGIQTRITFDINGLDHNSVFYFTILFYQFYQAITAVSTDDIAQQMLNREFTPQIENLKNEAIEQSIVSTDPNTFEILNQQLTMINNMVKGNIYVSAYALQLVISYVPLWLEGKWNTDPKQLILALLVITGIRIQDDLRPRTSKDQEYRAFFEKYGQQLLVKLFAEKEIIRELADPRNVAVKLSFLHFTVKTLCPFLIEHINNDPIDTILFLDQCCIHLPKQKFFEESKVLELLHNSIANKNEEEIKAICNLYKSYGSYTDLMPFITEPLIPSEVKLITLNESKLQAPHSALITLMSADDFSQQKKLHSIIFRQMMDKKTTLNHLIFLLEKINDRFCLTTTMMLAFFSEEYLKYDLDFVRAMCRIYSKPEGESILFMKPCPIQIEELSEPNLEFIQTIVNEIKQSHNYNLFAGLKYIANCFPFLFNQNPIQYFELVFDSVNCLENFFSTEATEGHDKDFMLAAAAMTFLHFILYTPQNLDSFFNWVYEKFSSLTNSQILVVSIILRSLYSVSSIQHVVTVMLLKYDWPDLFSDILERQYQSEEFQVLLFKHLFTLTSQFYRYLNTLNDDAVSSLSELKDVENPFTLTFDHSFVALPMSQRPPPLRLLNHPKVATYNFFIDNLQNDRFFKRQNRPSNQKLDKFHKDIDKIQGKPPVNFELPPGVDPEIFALLPTKQQSIVMHHFLPQQLPQEFNSAQQKFLARQPMWVYQWIHSPSRLLLLPEQYSVLLKVTNELLSLPEEEYEESVEDFTLEMFCKPPLFQSLVKLITTPLLNKLLGPLLTLINELSKSVPSFTAFLELLTPIIQNSQSKNEIHTMLRILLAISKSEHFKGFFPATAAPAVLNIVCSPQYRSHESLLSTAAELFAPLGDAMPYRVIHLIIFMLLSDKASLISSALILCSKLSDSKRDDVTPYVQSAFDRAVATYNPAQSNHKIIIEFLRRFKTVAESRHSQMLQLLRTLLTEFHIQSLDLVGALFDALSPQRNKSHSVRLSDSISIDQAQQLQGNNNIPSTIFAQSPDFWSLFCEFRIKIFDLIKDDIQRLWTTFKFLLNFPEILDFNTRVASFRYKMREKITDQPLDIHVSRANVLSHSYTRLHALSKDILLGRIKVSFIGEEGFDAGGPKREWYTLLVKDLFNPGYALFSPSANGRSYQPNPSSYVNPENLKFLNFAGKIIARALIDQINIDAHLTTSFCKHILQIPVSLRDLEDVDEELYNSLKWMLDNDVSDIDLMFTADYDDVGLHKTVPLKHDGYNIPVTNENKEEYVALMVEHRLRNQISDQIEAFRSGFYSLIPVEQIQQFSPSELDLLICGIPEIDVEDFRLNCEFIRPYHAGHPVVKYFFESISQWEKKDLAQLLLFMTGSSQVPINGFKQFKDRGQPITIQPGGPRDRLPQAHTCVNTLDLPEYESREELNTRLNFAIQECNSFGFI